MPERRENERVRRRDTRIRGQRRFVREDLQRVSAYVMTSAGNLRRFCRAPRCSGVEREARILSWAWSAWGSVSRLDALESV